MQACTTPAVLTGYEVDETELNPAQFAVVASCAEGYEGTAMVAACGEGGGEYTLGGCAEAPPAPVGPAVTPPSRLLKPFGPSGVFCWHFGWLVLSVLSEATKQQEIPPLHS